MFPDLVGLAGYAQTGKDTTANILATRYHYMHRKFSGKLKELALAVDPIVLVERGFLLRLSDVVFEDGWESAKENDEVRRILQVLGTEGGRRHLGQDVWVRPVIQGILRDRDWAEEMVSAGPCRHVVSDVRFPNEAEAVRQLGGVVLRVIRPGVKAINDHVSERALDEWPFDAVVDNSGTVTDLAVEIKNVLVNLKRGRREHGPS